MKPKTEELLNLLLWSAEVLARPTFRNLTDSYESWAYRRTGLLRQLSVLEKQQLVESNSPAPDERMFRLTAQGRLHALGGRDPNARWSRQWDGRWRMVLFDVPIAQNSHRKRLRRYLQDRGFGYLQGSVWVSPDPLEEERKSLLARRLMSVHCSCSTRDHARENPTRRLSPSLGTLNGSTAATPEC